MAKNKTDLNRALALAGVFQAAGLVSQVAREGQSDPLRMDQSLRTLFAIDADDVEAVYGSARSLTGGLELLIEQLRAPQDRDLTRYVVSLLHHASTVLKRPDIADQIREGLTITQARLEHFDICHENILAGLAEIYSQTISSLSPRIMVRGDPNHLSKPAVANSIRALLLAGLRSGVLWHQCGGGRLKLLLGRKSLIKAAQDLLART